jgi:RNA polymerase sigma-70 factor (ECF subfamily)
VEIETNDRNATNESVDQKADLLRLVAAGNTQAFAVLYHEHRQMIYNTALLYAKDEDLADDIVQDVFVKIWMNRAKLSDARDLKAFIYTITKNRCLTVLKKIVRTRAREIKKQQTEPQWQTDGTESLSEQQLETLVTGAIKLLTLQQRRVFELSRIEGKNRQQIAAEMGVAENTVRSHLTLALRTVRAFLLANLESLIFLILFSIFFKKLL